MTTLLQAYEEEYRETVKTVADELAALRATLNRDAVGYKAPPSTGAGSRLARISSMGAALARVRELTGSMEYECNDLPATSRQTVKDRISEYRANVRRLEESISKARAEASVADRQDLMGVGRSGGRPRPDGASLGPGELDDETREHRMQMMDNTSKFREASSKLKQAERILNDTETIGNEALGTLRRQTEQMNQINEVTIAVDAEVSQSRRILGNMQRTMVKHKATLVSVIAVLLFLIVVAVWVSVNKNRSHSAVTPPTIAPVDPIPVTPDG